MSPPVTDYSNSETSEGSGSGEGPDDRHEETGCRTPAFTPDLLALLAHQLLGPIATISASAQSVIRHSGELSEETVLRHAERIDRAARRLSSLTDQILARTRADAGAITLDVGDIDLKAIILKVCDEHRRRDPARRIVHDLSAIPD